MDAGAGLRSSVADPALPRSFSVIIPAYNAAATLPRLAESLERQTISAARVEIIVVDDGSTDATLSVTRSWCQRSRFRLRMRTRPHGGVAAARNVGLDLAEGDWVAFVDADDELDPQYFDAVDRVVADAADPRLVAVFTNLLRYDEGRGELREDHALAYRFRGGPHIVPVRAMAWEFQNSAASAVFARGAVVRAKVRFDPRVRPSFEDGHFVARFLLANPDATIALAPSAGYIYHQGGREASQARSSWRHPEKYDKLLVRGAGDLIQRAMTANGEIPIWLQRQLLYHLQAYFRVAARRQTPVDDLGPSSQHTFLRRLAQVLLPLDPAVILEFGKEFPYETESLLLLSCHPTAPAVYGGVELSGRATSGSAWNVRYLYTQRRPREAVGPQGEVEVLAAFSRPLVRFGRELVWERWLTLASPEWAPPPTLELSISGLPGTTMLRASP